VPNGFDLTAFRPDPAARESVRTELGLESQTALVGWIGRFHPQKNPEGFFEAAAKLHRSLPQVHFLIAGERMDSSNIAVARMVDASRLGPVTHLLGVRKDIPRLMAAMDVLASSSSGEAFSNVLGEAMSSGIPCAVTDVGDSANIVGESGRVVIPGDMAALAAQLEELLKLPECERLALGSRARKRVTECFEIQNVVRQYESFYDRLAAGELG
jgi:glycosyltransferase involved in cell wall biosynthesis